MPTDSDSDVLVQCLALIETLSPAARHDLMNVGAQALLLLNELHTGKRSPPFKVIEWRNAELVMAVRRKL